MKKTATFSLMIALTMVTSMASAADFKPFSKVKDICPKCPKTTVDTITLNNNVKIRAKVVAENTNFLVVQRYGELRTVPRTRIMSVDWANGSKSTNLKSQDQILLRNGHVLTGSIIEEKNKPTGYFRMRSSLSKQTYVVLKTQVSEAYKAGSRYNFKP